MGTVAQEARALGLAMAGKGEDHLKSVLPEPFMRLGISVHKDFDNISHDAQSIKDPLHTLRQLGEAMKKCDSCHASYQIRVKGDGGGDKMQPSQHSQPHKH
jgi:hypothetical protein